MSRDSVIGSDELDFLMSVVNEEISTDLFHAHVSYQMPNKPSNARFKDVLDEPTILEAIRSARKLDVETAREIAYAFKHAVRYLDGKTKSDIRDSVRLIARMSNMGYIRSREAIAAAMVPYIMCKDGVTNGKFLQRSTYFMSDAIEDEQPPTTTTELGLAQARRLWKFLQSDSKNGSGSVDVPNTDNCFNRGTFDGFPTIGAEVHIHEADEEQGRLGPNFWERLAVLNMSQYQRGSYVPFSRNDRGVIEIRMNPSVYPVSTANRNLMKAILPELADHYFWLCVAGDRDFTVSEGGSLSEEILLLQTLASLTYASFSKNARKIEDSAEVDFGEWHLSQTVRLHGEGKYSLDGNWGGNHGAQGQLNLFAGFGNSFPYQAYWVSMVAADRDLRYLFSKLVDKYAQRGMRPQDAVTMGDSDIKHILTKVGEGIYRRPSLRRAAEYGEQIVKAFSL